MTAKRAVFSFGTAYRGEINNEFQKSLKFSGFKALINQIRWKALILETQL